MSQFYNKHIAWRPQYYKRFWKSRRYLKNYRQFLDHNLPGNTLDFRNGVSFAAADADTALQVFDEVFVQDVYRIPSAETAKVIVDVGANIGLFSLYAHLKAPDAQIYSVEASPTTFRVLERNVKENGLSDKITPVCNALGGHVGNATFFETAISGWSSLYDNRGAENGTPVEVKMNTLATFCIEHNISDIDFLKIDIEGAEYEAILDSNDFFKVPTHAAAIEVDRNPRSGQYTFAYFVDTLKANYKNVQILESGDAAYPLVLCSN